MLPQGPQPGMVLMSQGVLVQQAVLHSLLHQALPANSRQETPMCRR